MGVGGKAFYAGKLAFFSSRDPCLGANECACLVWICEITLFFRRDAVIQVPSAGIFAMISWEKGGNFLSCWFYIFLIEELRHELFLHVSLFRLLNEENRRWG